MWFVHKSGCDRTLRKQDDGAEEKAGGEIQPGCLPCLSCSLFFYQPSSSLLPAGLTSTSHSTHAPPGTPLPEISTDLAAVAMVLGMTVGTTC